MTERENLKREIVKAVLRHRITGVYPTTCEQEADDVMDAIEAHAGGCVVVPAEWANVFKYPSPYAPEKPE